MVQKGGSAPHKVRLGTVRPVDGLDREARRRPDGRVGTCESTDGRAEISNVSDGVEEQVDVHVELNMVLSQKCRGSRAGAREPSVHSNLSVCPGSS